MENNKEIRHVSGKELLLDAEELLRKLGVYVAQIGKSVYIKIKLSLSEKDDKQATASDDITTTKTVTNDANKSLTDG